MKKLFFAMMAIVALFATSCQKEASLDGYRAFDGGICRRSRMVPVLDHPWKDTELRRSDGALPDSVFVDNFLSYDHHEYDQGKEAVF
jgi:hypothetical protein